MKRYILLGCLFSLLFAGNGCQANVGSIRRPPNVLTPVELPPFAVQLPPDYHWKSFEQMQADLNTLLLAGYTRLCLFDLPRIWGYPDPRFAALLRKHADAGVELAVYVQDVPVNEDTLRVVREIGASTVMVYDRALRARFNNAGISTLWWIGVAYPPNHRNRPQYLGWLDLRSAAMRQEIATWSTQVPDGVDGLSLDYIRWNELGAGRSAEQITDLVQRIRAQWRGSLSAAVRPSLSDKPGERDALAVGQNWDQWLNAGLLDYVYPMAYDSAKIPALVDEWRAHKNKIVPCLTDYARTY